MKKAEQKAVRKREIIEKSLDLFVSKGYASTKISDIANAVDMSVGLLFHYFESKEALYSELITIGVSGPQHVMNFEYRDSLDFFEKAASFILNLAREDKFSLKMFVLMKQAMKNDAVPMLIKERLKQADMFSGCIPLILKGQEEGLIKQGNPLALSVCFWSAIQGIMETLEAVPDFPIPDSKWLIDILRR